MLTYESLIEQAKERGMPHTNARGVLREYLQILILKELYRSELNKKMFFTGGTYLRLVHNTKRFSEDLDFETNSLSRKEFESDLADVTKEFSRLGMKLDLSFEHWGNVYSSRLIFKDIEKQYNIVSKYSKKEGIIIKVETCKVGYKIKTQPQMLSGFGEFFPYMCLTEGIIFANKIDTFLKKERGRHLYDMMFMLSKKFPIEKLVLKHLGIKQNPSDVILKRIEDLSSSMLKKMAENLRPFLFEEVEADMVLRAKELLPALLSAYERSWQ